MATWSQSHFLQSLGWATLNSFWQMGLLWFLFSGASSLFRISSPRKYQLSVLAIGTGFAWFLLTFFYYFQSTPVSGIALFHQPVNEQNSVLRACLLAASLAYLALLAFPAWRLFRNWRFVQRIKREGLHKADLTYRLFVQKISGQLGIVNKVKVYMSSLVNSPVTIGYLKPVILLPVAALNHLTQQQVEAILLHELSHIRRYDYLVNLLVSIISTFLYFNPFVRLFMKSLEEERENCCDELVLQFEYDKLGYASALLTLEKLSARQGILAMGAAGTNYLLSRIEKIVGMEKKKGFRKNQFAGILAALFCIVVFNSVLIIREKKKSDYSYAYNNLNNPFTLFTSDESRGDHSIAPGLKREEKGLALSEPAKSPVATSATAPASESTPFYEAAETPDPAQFLNVALDDVEAQLTTEQKATVSATVAKTKKVITSLQWKEMENDLIADAMTEKEKLQAKKEYLKAMDKQINWQNIEQNMKARYQDLDWQKINATINKGLALVQLDSLEKSYTLILNQLDKANAQTAALPQVAVTPLPDQSVEELKKSREELRRKVECIKAIRGPKKVVSL